MKKNNIAKQSNIFLLVLLLFASLIYHLHQAFKAKQESSLFDISLPFQKDALQTNGSSAIPLIVLSK